MHVLSHHRSLEHKCIVLLTFDTSRKPLEGPLEQSYSQTLPNCIYCVIWFARFVALHGVSNYLQASVQDAPIEY